MNILQTIFLKILPKQINFYYIRHKKVIIAENQKAVDGLENALSESALLGPRAELVDLESRKQLKTAEDLRFKQGYLVKFSEF